VFNSFSFKLFDKLLIKFLSKLIKIPLLVFFSLALLYIFWIVFQCITSKQISSIIGIAKRTNFQQVILNLLLLLYFILSGLISDLLCSLGYLRLKSCLIRCRLTKSLLLSNWFKCWNLSLSGARTLLLILTKRWKSLLPKLCWLCELSVAKLVCLRLRNGHKRIELGLWLGWKLLTSGLKNRCSCVC